MASGTKIADVWINIQGDLTNYNKSLAQAKTDTTSLGTQLTQAFNNPAGFSGTSPLANLVAGIRDDQSLGQSLGQSIQNAIKNGAFAGVGSEITSTFRGFLGSVGTNFAHDLVTVGGAAFNGLLNIGKSVFGTLTSIAGGVGRGLALGFGITAFLGVEEVVQRLASEIPDLISKGQQFAATVQQITVATGADSQTASKWLTIYEEMGGTATDFATKLNRVAVSVQTNTKLFGEYGIATTDANGASLNQIQILEEVQQLFQTIPDGTAKADLAVKLFGRNAGNSLGAVLNLLNLTPAQFQAASDAAVASGNVISAQTVAMGREYALATAGFGVATQGLGVTLFTDVAPLLISFVDGLTKDLEAHAQEIANFFGSVVATVVGLVQGLTGISLDSNSLSTQLDVTAQSGSDVTISLAAAEAQLTKYQKAVDTLNAHPVTDTSATTHVATQAITDETKAIDAQITSWTNVGTEAQTALDKEITGLNRTLQLQLDSLDAADKLAQRAKTAEQLQDAVTAAVEAQRKAQVDLASAQAQQANDNADTTLDPTAKAAAIAKDILAVQAANAALLQANQGLADAQQAITDNTNTNAEDDRKAQIAATQAYLTNLETITKNSTDKVALQKTLANREVALNNELTAAKAAGNAQDVADIELELQAVIAAAHATTTAAIAKGHVDELTAEKAKLAAETAALQAALADQTAVVKSAAVDQYNAKLKTAKQDVINEQNHVNALKATQTEQDRDAALVKQETADAADTAAQTYGSGGLIPTAFAASLTAGVNAANGIKAAFGSLMDLLLGAQDTPTGGRLGPPGPRSGGLLGALANISTSLNGIAGGFANILSGLQNFDPKSVGLAIAAAGVYFGQPEIIAAGLALFGVAEYADFTKGLESPSINLNTGLPNNAPTGPGGVTGPIPSIPHKAAGGWAGLGGQELTWLGEQGPEFVLSADMLSGIRGGSNFSPSTPSSSAPAGYKYALVRVESSGNDLIDWMYQGLNYRRGRA